MTTPADLFAALERLGISTQTVEHAPLFTVAQSQALRGEIPGGHTKNLFLKDRKGRFFLVVASEDARLDLKSLHRLIGAKGRLSFASADEMRVNLGVEPGSATPFAAINGGPVTIVLDEALIALERLNFHPLANTMTTTIASADLLRFLNATGHEPLRAPLSAGRDGDP